MLITIFIYLFCLEVCFLLNISTVEAHSLCAPRCLSLGGLGPTKLPNKDWPNSQENVPTQDLCRSGPSVTLLAQVKVASPAALHTLRDHKAKPIAALPAMKTALFSDMNNETSQTSHSEQAAVTQLFNKSPRCSVLEDTKHFLVNSCFQPYFLFCGLPLLSSALCSKARCCKREDKYHLRSSEFETFRTSTGYFGDLFSNLGTPD